MTVSPSLQRMAAKFWPVTVFVLSPLIVAEALNLWRKNRREN